MRYNSVSGNFEHKFYNNSNLSLTLASTGAATFSSSVTAQSFNAVSANPFLVLNDTSGSAAGSVTFQNNGTQKFNLTTLATTNNFALYNNGGTNSYNLVIAHSTGAATFSSSLGIGAAPTGTYGTLSVSGGVSIKNDNSAKLEIGRYSAGVPNSYIKLGPSSNSLRVTNNTDAADIFVIQNGGNVGIGTDSPGSKLEAYTTLGASVGINHGFDAGTYPRCSGIGLGAISTSYTVASGGGTISFVGGAGMYAENTASSGNPTNLVFWTNLAGTPAERMRLQANGVLKIGNGQTVDDGINPGYKNVAIAYNVAGDFGDIQAVQQLINVFTLRLNNAGGQVYAGASRLDNISDERMKTDIEPITNALEKVKQLSGKKFHLIDEEEGKIRYGFIAQDLEGILDDFVVNTSMTYKNKEKEIEIENVKSIESWASSWSALLVEAIKEQQEIINEMRAEIDSLKTK
jgi:hypothetical protein